MRCYFVPEKGWEVGGCCGGALCVGVGLHRRALHAGAGVRVNVRACSVPLPRMLGRLAVALCVLHSNVLFAAGPLRIVLHLHARDFGVGAAAVAHKGDGGGGVLRVVYQHRVFETRVTIEDVIPVRKDTFSDAKAVIK